MFLHLFSLDIYSMRTSANILVSTGIEVIQITDKSIIPIIRVICYNLLLMLQW